MESLQEILRTQTETVREESINLRMEANKYDKEN